MKKYTLTSLLAIMASGFFLVSASPVLAVSGQWSSNGSNIFYNDGNVGLGTSAPYSKLSIANGDLRLSAGRQVYFEDTGEIRSYDANHRILFRRNEDKTEIREFGNIIFSAGSTSGQETDKLVVTSSGAVSFGSTMSIVPVSDSFGTGVRYYMGYGIPMTVLNDGRIGINTYKPSKQLSVNGTIVAKEVIVSNNATYWPDYVFDLNYKMMPLSEIESYIKENNHLPNIPSASTIAQDGQSLSDIQTKQMEKIEELTLYIIQQDKEIKDLSSRLDKLEAQK